MTVNNSYTVKSGSVASKGKPGLTYVDYRIPKRFWPFLDAHEQEERKMMAKGVPYAKAHTDYATPVERAKVEAEGSAWGYSWKRYEEAIDGELDKVETQKGDRPSPPDPHVDPDTAVEAGKH